MSTELINRNPDLLRLRNEGYDVEVRNGYLVIHSVPYVNSRCEIAHGTLVTDLTLNNDLTQRPGNHQVWFAGEHPCNRDGSIISAMGDSAATQTLCERLEVQHRFSCKPPVGYYTDYHSKMTQYVKIISNPARAIDPSVTACTYKPIKESEEDSIFFYTDSASSRAGITALAKKIAMDKVAFVGLGGTGSYALDLVAKTHVREIHLFDGDKFLQHNAFRAPGAASFNSLENKHSKVHYYTNIYGQMRRGIFPHDEFLNEETIKQLAGFDFVFLCVDNGTVRKQVSDFLREQKIAFIDVGMNLELIEEQQSLRGTCRVTLSTPEKSDHFHRHVSTFHRSADDLYHTNIQIADMNALNAALAVIKWKKYCGFYQDCCQEHQSSYALEAHALTRDEMPSVERA